MNIPVANTFSFLEHLTLHTLHTGGTKAHACTTNILARAVHKNILPGARPDTQANLHS
jgi:hypothetical protein